HQGHKHHESHPAKPRHCAVSDRQARGETRDEEQCEENDGDNQLRSLHNLSSEAVEMCRRYVRGNSRGLSRWRARDIWFACAAIFLRESPFGEMAWTQPSLRNTQTLSFESQPVFIFVEGLFQSLPLSRIHPRGSESFGLIQLLAPRAQKGEHVLLQSLALSVRRVRILQ